MMIKVSYLCITSAVMVLSSCASFNSSRSIDDIVLPDKNVSADGYDQVNYGEPTRNEARRIEERKLTPAMISVLKVPDAVSVVAFDLLGNPIEFTRQGKNFIDQDVVYPAKTSQIGNVYTMTYVWFEGSHCFDRTDSLGRSRRICPKH